MAQPLTKLTKTGELYTRPPSVEANIDQALGDDLATLRARLQVTDRQAAHYLTSECLMHLFRDSSRRGDEKKRDTLVQAILTRCEAILKSKVPDSRVANAADIREDILQEFALLLAKDSVGENPSELDFFECRFNQAFRTFRVSKLRIVQTPPIRCVPLPDESDIPDDQVPKILGKALSCRASQEDDLALNEMLDALPADIREAVVLCYLMDYEEESEDPTRITAATLCDVTGRTIRNRLGKAAAYLKHFNEEEP
jgi:DNA-directed RNA polymerase specialized sigma24 family protein